MKIRRDPLDKLFSDYVRTRDRWTCQRCRKRYRPPTNALHCAHIFTRRARSTRWAPENAVSWCYGCHSYMDQHPQLKYAWYTKRFGQRQFEALQLAAHTPKKVDREMTRIALEKALELLKPPPELEPGYEYKGNMVWERRYPLSSS